MFKSEEAEKKWLANVQFHGAFKDFFGSNFVLFKNGKECEFEFNRFATWFIEQCFPEGDMDEEELLEILRISDELFNEEREIGIEVDEFEGMFIGIEYGKFKKVFYTGVLDEETKKLIQIYLADVHVPDYIIYKNIMQNPDITTKIFKEILEEEPLDLNVHYFLVELLRQTEKFEEARHEYQRLLELIPEDSLTLHNYAILLTDMGEFEEAERIFKKAIQLEPDDIVFRLSYGDFLKALNRDIEAEKEYETAKWLKGEDI
ncbi:MAG: tetratricopeptide repeat protein [Candidatus Syntropharchaeales archaeon]